MKFITSIEEKRFNRFVESHPQGHALQTVEWGKFKSAYDWDMELVGMEDHHQTLIAGAMLLRRKLPFIKKTILYAPRGFVIDYDDKKLLDQFVKEIKAYAKKSKAIFVKIDPCIKKNLHDGEGQLIEGGLNNEPLIDHLKSLGFNHKGTTTAFEGVQPRFVYILDIDKSEEDLLKNFHHKTRYNIRLAKRKGIEIYEGTQEDLVDFERIMKVTGERDHFITRPLSYFQKMFDYLVPSGRMKLFMARYNVKKALKEVNDAYEKALRKNETHERLEKLSQEKEELEALVKKHPEGILVSGTILLITGKRAWYLYGASDNIYRNLMPNYLIQWEMIQYAKKQGCKIYDFRGISGDLSKENPLYGLFRFKKGFNGEFVEYIGEFDLIIHRFYYQLWEFWLPKLKKILRRLKNK